MVEIQVAVEDPARLKGLLTGLAGLLDGSSLAFDEDRNELCFSTEWEPGDVDEVIGVFEAWLASAGVGASARLCIGEAAYELVGSAGPRQASQVAALVPELELVAEPLPRGSANASHEAAGASHGASDSGRSRQAVLALRVP
jgi:hypothetical protein